MTTVFCRVTAELSEDFVQIFPHQFDFQGLLQKIAEDAGVTVSTSDTLIQNDRAYSLQGLWPEMEKARNMLLTLVYSSVARCEQESQINLGSRPFSALVEAAEAMSRGAELQEQVENELALIKNSTLNGSLSSVDDIPVTMNRIQRSLISQGTFDQENPVVGSYSNQTNTQFQEKKQEQESFNISPIQESDVKENVISQPGESIQKGIIHKIISEELEKENKAEQETEIQIYFTNNSEEVPSSNEVKDTDISNSDTEKSIPVKKRQKRTSAQQTVQSTAVLNKNRTNKKTKPSTRQTSLTDVKIPPEIELSLVKSEGADNKTTMKDAVTQAKPEIETPFACEFFFCDFVAKNRKAYTDHTQRVHLSEPSQCDICNKVFANERYMKRHQVIHGEPKHCCGKCGKVYRVQRALENHLKTHDPDYKPPEFQCDLCSKSFCTNYLLMCHKKSEHFGQKKSFLCSVCGKSFTTKHTLQQHVNVHTGVRPYACETCGKSFSYESALRDHKNIHLGTKKFICSDPMCNKTFLQRSALKMHEKIHRDEKDFICTECGRGFTQKQALQRHIRAHKGDKSFTCKLCFRSFGDASIVRRHLILVHKTHKDVTNWREDVVISSQEKENEDEETRENENTSNKTQTDNILDKAIISHQKVEPKNQIKGQPVIQLATSRESKLLPASEISHKIFETVPVQILQASEIPDHHYTTELVTKTGNLFSKKTNVVTSDVGTNEEQAMEYPIVSLLQSNIVKNSGDILNYEYVLPVTPHDPSYGNIASSSEVDHSGYTKVVLDKPVDDIKVGGPLTLTDTSTVAHLIETTREIPVLPEASTVLAGPSTQDGLLLAGSVDQVKVRPEVLTAEKIMEIVKHLQETDLGLMDPQQMQTLYSYYNALATQYFSLAQYAPVVPTTDNSGDHQ